MKRLRRPFLEWITTFGLPPAVSIAQLVLGADVPEADKQRIWAKNAVEFFKLAA